MKHSSYKKLEEYRIDHSDDKLYHINVQYYYLHN